MLIDRIFTPGLAQVAYMVADEATGDVAVIDPRRDVDVYVEWAAERKLRIVAILETHVHADYVSGSLELADRTGAPIYASWIGGQTFDFVPLSDGQRVPVGRGALQAVWTPGHTPEHIAFLLVDPERGPEPTALFSGDVLFVGDVGRPDLLGKEQTEELATRLYHTVTDRLAPLADDVVVYPGHTAGSSCGKKIGDAPSTTIGQERHTNYAFQAESLDSFVKTVMDGMPLAPTYYPTMKKVNKDGAVRLESLADPVALSVDLFVEKLAEGAILFDIRDSATFGRGHVPGSIGVGLGPDFVAWAGWLAPYDRPIVLVLDEARDLDEVVTELRRIGLDSVDGYLDGGIDAWSAAGRPVATLAQFDVNELVGDIKRDEGLVVLDVRSADEWRDGHISGAKHLFAGEIAQGAVPGVAQDRRIAVICGSGYRSTVAASLLMQRGFTNLVNVSGGMEAWIEAGLPVTSDTTN